MFFKKAFLTVFLVFMGALLPVLANAQNQFTNSMNFESSKLPYNWHTSAWTACAGECNGGTQIRAVDCKDNSGNDAPSGAAATECDHTPKPADFRTCDLPGCQWVAGTCPVHQHYTSSSSSGGDDSDDKVTDPDTGKQVNQDTL